MPLAPPRSSGWWTAPTFSLLLPLALALSPSRGSAQSGSCPVGDDCSDPPPSTATRLYPTISTLPHNGDNRSMTLCALDCFDNVVRVTTPAYVSMDAARAVTLVYRSAQAAPVGMVQVDVTDSSPEPASKLSLRLKRADGSYVTFTSGATQIFYHRAAGVNRLAAQFDASGLATGAYDYTAVVTSHWSTGPLQATAPVRVLVVNERGSAYGAGWSVAGLQRIHSMADGSKVITEGDGSVLSFAEGTCTMVSVWERVCTYTPPKGDFTRLSHTTQNDTYRRHYPDGTELTYTGAGYLRYADDRFGNRTSYAYDGSNRLSTVTDPAGKAITFGYGTDGKLDWIKDPGGRYTYATINGASDITAVQDPAGYTVTLSYDGQHRLQQRLDARLGHWDFAYDFAGKLRTTTLPMIAVDGAWARPVIGWRTPESRFLVDPASGYGTSANPAGSVAVAGTYAEVTDARGFLTSYALDRFGAPTRIQAPLGRTTVFARNAHSQVYSTTSPSGNTVSYTWVGSNLVRVYDSGTGRIVTTEYEPTYNQVKRVYGDVTRVWNYWSGGKLDSTQVGDSTKPAARFTYDNRGRVKKGIDPEGHPTEYFYASAGWQNTDSTKRSFRRTAYTYDALGRVQTTTDPRNAVTRTSVDALNRVRQVVGPLNDTTTYTFDALYLTEVRDAKGQTYRYFPNALGWADSTVDPRGVAERHGYDRNGNQVGWVNRRGQLVTFTFDALNQLSGRTADGATTTYATDPLGWWTMTANGESVDTVFFDAAGRVTREVTWREGRRYQHTESHDAQDRRAELVIGGWSVGYRYNALGQLDSLRDLAGRWTTFRYNNDMQLSRTTFPNATSRSIAYPSTHTPGGITYTPAALNVALGERYTRDSLGNVRDRLNPEGTSGREHRYDALGRHTGFANWTMSTPACEEEPVNPGETALFCPDGSKLYNGGETYTYDAAGNRTDNAAASETGNRLTHLGRRTMMYYEDGSLRWKFNDDCPAGRECHHDYAWNSVGQLTSAWTADAGTASYGYDGWGRRIRRTHHASGYVLRYVYDGDDLLMVTEADGHVLHVYTYYPGVDQPHSVLTNGRVAYYQQDAAGNVVGLVNDQGALEVEYAYTPFGQVSTVSGAKSHHLYFKGRELDPHTGLVYMRARWYDPELGRFISEDPIGLAGGINPYVFAGNDPVNGSDPSGKCPPCAVGGYGPDTYSHRLGEALWQRGGELIGGLVGGINVGVSATFGWQNFDANLAMNGDVNAGMSANANLPAAGASISLGYSWARPRGGSIPWSFYVGPNEHLSVAFNFADSDWTGLSANVGVSTPQLPVGASVDAIALLNQAAQGRVPAGKYQCKSREGCKPRTQ